MYIYVRIAIINTHRMCVLTDFDSATIPKSFDRVVVPPSHHGAIVGIVNICEFCSRCGSVPYHVYLIETHIGIGLSLMRPPH